MTASGDFDVCGPLPTGVTVLEASAGTGKTYTIAALATRYVAEGLKLEHLLLVTFTRMATGELRDRVRQRLATARAALDAALVGVDSLATGSELVDHVGDDPLLRLLASGARAAVEERRDRLAQALADFDAATITTTHGFCQEVFGGLGVAGDVDRAHRFSEDARELVGEVVDDLYVGDFLTREPLFDREAAEAVVRAAIGNPTAPLAPAFDGTDGGGLLRHDLATAARDEVARRKRGLALMTYDDFVTGLRTALERADGAEVAARMRARYCVALVDEFQDTDPDQWAILRMAFAEHDGTTLILIGDPKQAVYAFRGADVYAYLDAARSAAARPTLAVNWRSDRGLLQAYDTLFGDAHLGHPEIAYRKVVAAPANERSRLLGAPVDTPLRIRVVARRDPDVARTPTGWSKAPAALAFVARDVAGDIRRLLRSDPLVQHRDAAGATVDEVPLEASDVAVLVRTNKQALLIKQELEAIGVPAVINGGDSIFASAAARAWLSLLEAMERPESLARARAVALTAFIGWTTEDVATADSERWADLQQLLHGWARVLRHNGVATVMEAITLHQQLPKRLLSSLDGERELTDLRHMAELLHGAAVNDRLGVTALAGWLRRRMAADERDGVPEDRMRRLESDRVAVQVLTIHRSKGLEFGVVYCPFMWNPFWIPETAVPAIYHDADNADVRTIDVSMESRDETYVAHVEQGLQETRGEELRLAYVALTRAKHQAVIWWATIYYCRNSALGSLLLKPMSGRPDQDQTVAEISARLSGLAAAAPDAIVLERALVAGDARGPLEATQPPELAVATFDRSLDRLWRRMSYSAIIAGVHEARVASEVEEAAGSDDPAADAPLPEAEQEVGDADLLAVGSLLSDLPAGTRTGIFVHRVLELVDFAAVDLAAELSSNVADAQRRSSVNIGDPTMVVNGLRAVLETPLGPLAAGRRLCDLARADRLDELAFELPLAGGDEPTGDLSLAAIAAVLREHLDADDPLVGYPDRLADPVLKANFRGYLTGAIDLVARFDHGAGMVPAFAIVDYKTNRLAAAGEALTAWHYRPAALVEEMQRSHYALQALLYAVAVHRYLRWRLPGYDAERDRPAVLYLFVRGMSGADTPRTDTGPCGVFSWRPPVGLLPALSDVLDRRSTG